jgi:hypothetical protein
MKKKPVCIALFSDRDEFECCSTMIASVLRRTDRDVEILCFCRGAWGRDFESGRLKVRFLALRPELNVIRDSDWCALQVLADAPDWERCLVLGKSQLVFRDLGELFDLELGNHSIAGFPTGGVLGDEMGRAREAAGVLQDVAGYSGFHPTLLIDLKKTRPKGADAAWLEFLEVVKSGAGPRAGLAVIAGTPAMELDAAWRLMASRRNAAAVPQGILSWYPGEKPWAKYDNWGLDYWESEQCSWEALRMGQWEKPLAVDVHPAGLNVSRALAKRGWRVIVEHPKVMEEFVAPANARLLPDLCREEDSFLSLKSEREQVKIVRFGASGGDVGIPGHLSGAAAWMRARDWYPSHIVLAGPVADDERISVAGLGYREAVFLKRKDWAPGGVDPTALDFAGRDGTMANDEDRWGAGYDVYLRRDDAATVPAVLPPSPPGIRRVREKDEFVADEWEPLLVDEVFDPWWEGIETSHPGGDRASSINVAFHTADAGSVVNSTLVHSIARRTRHPVHVRCYFTGKGRESFCVGNLLVEFIPAVATPKHVTAVTESLQVIRDHPPHWDRCWIMNADQLVLTDLARMKDKEFTGESLVMAFPHIMQIRQGEMLVTINRRDDQFHLAGAVLNLRNIRKKEGWRRIATALRYDGSDPQMVALAEPGVLQPLPECWHHGVYYSDLDRAHRKMFPTLIRTDNDSYENFGILHFDNGPRPWEDFMAGNPDKRKDQVWLREYASWEKLEEGDWSRPAGCEVLDFE